MNLLEVYNVSMWHVFGTEQPPAADTTFLQAAAEGIISNKHRKIQEDFNYWFMEALYSQPYTAYDNTLALPTGFKCEMRPVRALLFDTVNTYTTGTATCAGTTAVTGTGTGWLTEWTGKRYRISFDSGTTWYFINSVASSSSLTLESAGPTATASAFIIQACNSVVELDKQGPGRSQLHGLDVLGYGDPAWYEIFDDTLSMYPLPQYDGQLEYRYYKYLPRPTVFATHTDDLATEAADLLIYMTVAEIADSQGDDKKAAKYEEKAAQELGNLKKKHLHRTAANFRTRYVE